MPKSGKNSLTRGKQTDAAALGTGDGPDPLAIPPVVTRPAPPAPATGPATDLELAQETDLVAAVRRDIEAAGLVGESDAGLLVYLAYSSRKRSRPLSVIVKGPSGSGKDEVQRRPADLIPPADVLDLMSLTPQALYYGEPGWLMNKVLLGGERRHQDDDAQRDRTVAVRQMLSHGYITKQTVVDGEGVYIRQDGPVSYSETTTKDSVFKEDANRCLQVNTDPDPGLTARILDVRAAAYLPGPGAAADAREAAMRRHHEFQAALVAVDVRIPYAKVLASRMPRGKIEIRRVFGHVLSLIEVIAYLHQFNRGRNAHDQLEATVEDYGLARQLALGPLHAAIGLGKDHARCAEFAKKLPAGMFTTTTAAKALDAKSRKVVNDWLSKLEDVGIIRCVRESQGNQPALWAKTGRDVDEVLLPSPAALAAAVAEAGQG